MEGRNTDASLWTPVCRSRHLLFIAQFLMLQSGISHRISPEKERKGQKDARRRVIKGYDEGEVGQNKGKGMAGEDDEVITGITLSKVNLHE